MKRVSIFLIAVALVVGMAGCGDESYTLTIASTAGGNVTTPGEGTFTYDAGTVVSLNAIPDTGYQFVNWTGNVSTIADVNAAATNITMSGNYSITANFEQEVVYFADPHIEFYVRCAIGKLEGPIYAADLEGLTSLSVMELEISNLSGLEFCTSLTSLFIDCCNSDTGKGEISDISPLANLTNLTSLSLSCNQIIDISPLANLTNLTWLNLAGNQISDISPVASLTGLETLALGWNPIDTSSLANLTGLTSLTELSLCGSEISDISFLASLTNLTELWLQQNQISDFSPLASLTNLTELYLGANQISDISSLPNLGNLAELSLEYNQISNISAVANLTGLTELDLSSNQITDISPLASLTNLISLDLSENQISDIGPLVENQGLSTTTTIWLWENPLSSDSINIHIPQLRERGVQVNY